VLDASVSLQEAKNLIWRRETGQYGCAEYRHKERPGIDDMVVDESQNLGGVPVVLYTRIGSNFPAATGERLADAAVKSARTHSGKVERDGISYLISAIEHGIATPLTDAYKEAILSKTGTSSLRLRSTPCEGRASVLNRRKHAPL
jgi:hypothetical protein